MKPKQNIYLLICSIAAVAFITSCKRKYDSPPPKTVKDGTVYTVKQLKALYSNAIVRFPADASVFATVTADEKSGNFYKTIFIQDSTGALQLNLLSSGGVYRGDSVRIALKGTRLLNISGMFQLDSVSTDNNVFKQTAGKNINPQVVTLTDIQTVSEAMKGKLIQINDVEFSCNDVGTTYSDAVSFSTVNKTLEDCNGKKVLIRTSGYAKFAGTQVKKGKGSLIGIITVYNTTPQLFIRDLNDVQLSDNDADRCPNNSCNFYLRKNFEDGSVTSNGWTNVNVSGAINWAAATTASQFGTYYCIASNYVGGVNNACETWLVSPAVNLTSSTHPVLNFQSATKYTGPAMEVYVSTDYVNAPINSGSWTRLYPTLSSGNFTWTASGNVDLSMYKSSAVRLAFKYSGTASNGASWELDEIIVKEQ